MRKHVFGRQLKRDINERRALFMNLASELVMHEKIVTTEEKAKSIRRTADKLVTKAKKQNTMHATSLLQPFLTSEAVKKMVTDIAPRFAQRNGGYTRIIRLGRRFNDNAQTVRMEWVEHASPVVADKKVAKALPEGKAHKTQAVKTAAVAKPAKKAIKKTATKKGNEAK